MCYIYSPARSTKLVVFSRSSPDPQSFWPTGASVDHTWSLASSKWGQVFRMWTGVCSVAPHWHCADFAIPIFFRCLLRPQWPVLRRNSIVWPSLSSMWMLSFLKVYPSFSSCDSCVAVSLRRILASSYVIVDGDLVQFTYSFCQLISYFVSLFSLNVMGSIGELFSFSCTAC